MSSRLITGCVIASILVALIGLIFLTPGDDQQRFNRMHKDVERIAFGADGNESLREAVTMERLAYKDVYLNQAIGRMLVWLSVAISSGLLVSVLLKARSTKLPRVSVEGDGKGTGSDV